MENVRFKLKAYQKGITPTNQKQSLISLYFAYGYCKYSENGKKTYIPLAYSTGLKIKPHRWNNKTYRAKQTSNFDYQSFNTALDNIETTIKKLYRENPNSTPEQLKHLLDLELHPEKIEASETMTLNKFIDKFINDIETGGKKTSKGTNYTLGSVKAYRNFKVVFDKFQKSTRKKYDFYDITMDFYNSYTKFLNKRTFSPNTIGKHIKSLKAILNDAKELKLHNNTEYSNKSFKRTTQSVDKIYLNEIELRTIYNLDLSSTPHLGIARDVFLAGCYTAQRYSDYKRINVNHIKNNGFIELIQIKTGEKVIIPIRTELNEILKKYNYNLPKTYEQKINKYVKEIGKLADINEITTVETIKGGLKIKKQVPKYELISTHTARRSGATNMYLAGIPTIDIMKLTGHRTESSFLRYVKVTKQETAQNLSMHPFFNTMVAN